MQPLRLLFVSHSFPLEKRPSTSVGGMQRVAVELSEFLPRHANLSLLVLRSAWKWNHLLSTLWYAPTTVRIWLKARRGEIDAVLFSSMVSGGMSLLLHRSLSKRGIPMAAIAHGKDVTQKGVYQWFLVRRILKRLAAVLPVSRATGAACAERGMPESKIHVIPNGVKLSRFATNPYQPVPSRPLLLCSVGRMVRRKGFEWFIREVMPHLPEHVHYHIGGHGPEYDRIAKTIRKWGLNDRVKLLGMIPEQELLELYTKAHLLIVPNIPVQGDMEGFGIVMLEAGTFGVPAIAARLEGIQDVITENINGHLVTSQDGDAFIKTITRYLNTPEELTELSTRTRRHTRKHFGWDAIARRYVQTMESLRLSV